MQIRHFTTRLSPEFMQPDQDKINAFMEMVIVKKTATQFVPGNPDYWSILVFYENGIDFPSPAALKLPAITEADLSDEEMTILSALKLWRKDKASEAHVPEFLICHNSSLLDLAKSKPRAITELEKVKGFGPQKIARYGQDIMAVLNAF